MIPLAISTEFFEILHTCSPKNSTPDSRKKKLGSPDEFSSYGALKMLFFQWFSMGRIGK